MLHRSSLLVALLAAGCVAEPDLAAPDGAEPDGVVETEQALGTGALAFTFDGLVRGTQTATVRAFRGIPYAAPPVGARRWREARPHVGWQGVRDATAFGPHCPQLASPFGLASTDEDCLFVNVFAPRHGLGLRPVMVWIHGGGLTTGESDDYDPTALVERGVVVVTLNYRLGALGFLSHAALTAESPDGASGNYGVLDQQAALRWVRRNILFFGGDPDRVTIFGESAGGLSVHAHLASPASAPLFDRAIVQSGAYELAQRTLADAEVAGAAFAAAAGCADAATAAACLRAKSPAEILAIQATGLGAARLTIDDRVLPQSIGAAFATGAFHRVPILAGSNHDEWRLFVGLDELTSGPVTPATYPAAIQATLGIPAQAVPLFLAQYPLSAHPSPALALSALGTDGIFACNARFAAQQLSRFVPTYAYEFSDPNAPPLVLPPATFPYGAAHAFELPYLFELRAIPAPFTPAQQALSDAMLDAWTTFARTGRPGPAWPRYRAATDTVMSLVPPAPAPTTTFAADHRCAFWDALR